MRKLVMLDASDRVIGFVTLHAPAKLPKGRRSRVDSFEVRSEWGDVLVERGGLHEACRAAIGKAWPKEIPRDAYSALGA